MQLIKEIFKAAQDLQENSPKDFAVGQNYQKAREALILGMFVDLYNSWSEKLTELIYCKPGDPGVSRDSPDDFVIYDQNGSRICDMQVFQVMDPGRKIGDEWRNGVPQGLREIPNTEDPYEQLRRTLRKKLTRRYRRPSWLLIHAQNWSVIYKEDYPGDLGEAALPAIGEMLREFDLTKIGITEIWIQSPNGSKAFRIFPSVVRLPESLGI